MGDTYDDYKDPRPQMEGRSDDMAVMKRVPEPTLMELEGMIGQSLEKLSDTISELMDKLSPVTRPEDTKGPTAGGDSEDGNNSELYARLAHRGRAIDAQTARIRMVIRGVQL